MPITFEQAEMAFRKAGVDYSTADVMTCIERGVMPNETPLQAAARKASERNAEAQRNAADSAESQAKAARREHFAKQFPAVFS
jgi:hypothetical protein